MSPRLVPVTIFALVLAWSPSAPARPSADWIRSQQRARTHAEVLIRRAGAPAQVLETARNVLCHYRSNPEVRSHVFRVLEERPDPGQEALAVAYLKADPDPRVRRSAARLLGEVGGEEARAALSMSAESDPDSKYHGGCFVVTENARKQSSEALLRLEERLGKAPGRSLLDRASSWLTGPRAPKPGQGTPAPDCAGAAPIPPEPPEVKQEPPTPRTPRRPVHELVFDLEDAGDCPPDDFLRRWEILKAFVLSLHPEDRRDLFTYGQLVRLRSEFKKDPEGACVRLDGLVWNALELLRR